MPRRKGMTVSRTVERWLGPILNYIPTAALSRSGVVWRSALQKNATARRSPIEHRQAPIGIAA